MDPEEFHGGILLTLHACRPPFPSLLMGNIIHYSEGVRSVVCCVAVVELL